MQARIKKIMQLDNEIGKVALATPILICKSLMKTSHSHMVTNNLF